ncbi:hypothetical protein IMSAGC017_01742 [Thomasclavelia cocleata]|uniref:Lipoprotein n=1 Tax=Thomasclavelia cocleata TaxID=69824 RepID=A0A829ZCH7_9FIRM|nr:hypothetical protein [Thomasclavelia cocleata]GFI41697.1 hypothetical protein IMSAGC017_01742 [Thomasclavelia cocleata]
MKLFKVFLCFVSLFMLSGCGSKKDYSSVDNITKDVIDISKISTARDDSIIKSDFTYVVSIRCDGDFDKVVNNVDGFYGEYDEDLNLARLYFKSGNSCKVIGSDDQEDKNISSLYAYYNVYGRKEKLTISDSPFRQYTDTERLNITIEQKDKIEKQVMKTYDQTLKDLTLEDDEDLMNYFDWIINNQDIGNKKIEH